MTLGRFASCSSSARICIGCQLGFVGMNPDRGVDEFVLFGQLDAAIQSPRPVTVANRDDGLYSCCSCPRDHLLAIGLELLAIEMSVGIDENRVVGRWPLVVQSFPLCNSAPSVV